ncbi:MAG: TlpA disulfide reductase family protein [Candidatus Bipolaricaulota bacterium]|nr:TlpA family protein disulfide reductase [Candidatus Bipolaricaulota bacterium]MDW8328622.1 TlpA disulfide reductase family protein [Candidatus Bipolaricaulota bacterium]
MLKRLIVGMIILVGAVTLAVISYSFFAERSDLSRFTLSHGAGFFVEDPNELQKEVAPRLGYLAPEISLPDLKNQIVRLSDLRGKPVLLNFWAAWCPPCRQELPDLQRFHEQFGTKIALIGVNWGEPAQTVRSFLERYGVTYTNLLDERGTAFVTYRLTGTPTTFFIDPEGHIRGVWLGPLKGEEIAQNFQRLGLLHESE